MKPNPMKTDQAIEAAQEQFEKRRDEEAIARSGELHGPNQCPHCDSSKFKTIDGRRKCSNCGRWFDEQINSYMIRWMETHPQFAKVEARNPEEALAKAARGEFIEGTFDSEPGHRVSGFTIEPQ